MVMPNVFDDILVLGVIFHLTHDYTSFFQISSGKHAGIAAELIELSPEAFWILGLLNNFLWVVMNAGAGSINEDCQKCGEFRYLQNHRTSMPIPMLPIRLMIKNCEKEIPMRDTNPGIPDIETQNWGLAQFFERVVQKTISLKRKIPRVGHASDGVPENSPQCID